MPYPPISNYYGSSTQATSSGNSAYSSNRNASTYNYPSSVTGNSNNTYNSSSYNYPAQSTYSGNSNGEPTADPYSSTSNYGYQRSGSYETQDTSMNDAYTQGYYARDNLGANQQHQQSQSQPEGLSNLAYASGLESATSRSSSVRNAQQFSSSPSATLQSRVRSPVDNNRYSTNPPSSTSHPMQQQASTSSNANNHLAVNAAAALAGVVNRQYSNQQRSQNASTSPSISAVRTAINSIPQRTASPQVNNMSHAQPSYAQTPSYSNASQNAQSSYSAPQQYTSAYDIPPTTSNSGRTNQAGGAGNKGKGRSAQNSQSRQTANAPRRDIQQTGSIANLVSAAHESDHGYAAASNAQDSAPSFIDPTAVFDPYHRERERKKLEAAARAKRKAEEDARAEELRQQQEQQEQMEVPQQTAGSTAKPGAKRKNRASNAAAAEEAAATPAVTEGENMALELKAMMEKMKAYQNKDPSLFKKLWNDIRQPGAGSSVTNLQSPSPQTTPRTLPKAPTSTPAAKKTPVVNPISTPQPPATVPVTTPTTTENARRSKTKSARVGPDGNKLHLNGYPVVVENNSEGLPDLGRFPAERRIRPNKYILKDKIDGQSPETSLLIDDDDATATPTASSSKRPGSAKSKAKANNTPAALTGALSAATGMTPSKANAATSAASGTVWPLEKRNALTATALKALKAVPENANIPLTEDDLRKMLENNPSYITLCELLEARGLKFHRGQFARELLNSVPELKAPQAEQKATANDTAQSNSDSNGGPVADSTYVHPPGLPVPPPGYMVQFHPPDQPPNGHFIPAPQQWGQGALFPSTQGHPPPSPSTKKPKIKVTHRPEPPPGSKEAAARKRGFADLIDLSELGDDDNYVFPDKHPRLDEPDSDVEMQDNPLQAFQRSAMPPPPQQVSVPPTSGWFPPSGQPAVYNAQQSNAQPRKDMFADGKGQRMILAKTLNKGEALKKQYYDPKTVARDVLIASGRHPYERPLNVHLAGMLGKYLDLDSDVSTFEWEELDPGGPPIPEVQYVDIPATKPRFKLGERGIRKQRSRVNIADTTRQPEMEKRPNPAAPPGATAQEQSPLSNRSQPTKFKKHSGLRHSLLASDAQATPATFDPTRLPQIQSDHAPVNDSTIAMADNAQPVAKKRGRPFGSKNKYPSMASLRNQAAGLNVNVPSRESREDTPRRDKFKCKWKQCQVVLHNLDTLRKHIGRSHRPSTDEIAAGEGYTCWWKHCQFIVKDESTGDFHSTKKFDEREEWIKHVEREHITPIAMKYGDGPSAAHVDPNVIKLDREKYCANKQQQQVTPIISDVSDNNQSYPADPLTLTEEVQLGVANSQLTDQQKTDKTAFLSYMSAHNLQSRDYKVVAKEVVRAMEMRKKEIGPGIDRGGCTLVTQAMRENFNSNPGIRRVIDNDD